MKEIDDGPSHALDRFREYSPLRVGIEQEIVAVSDFNCSSSAANNTCTPTPIEPTAKPTINRSEPHNLKKGPKRSPFVSQRSVAAFCMVLHRRQHPLGARASHSFPCVRASVRAQSDWSQPSSLRVLQRLEPIANVLGDILVLAVVAGVDAERWVKDSCDKSDCRDSDFLSSDIYHFTQTDGGSDPAASIHRATGLAAFH